MKRFFFLWFLFFSGIILAGNVTEEKARQIAVSFWQSRTVTRGGGPLLQMAFHSENLGSRASGQSPAYYVFDNTGGPGFVIVAGDDVAMPVLGYSFEDEFSKDNLPVNLKAWLEYMRDEIDEARRRGGKAEAVVTQAWSNIKASTPVVQLETAQWNQTSPYNLLCPTINGQPTYTGCMATALAIVMRYHQWPEKGIGILPGYQTETSNIYVPDLPLEHAYDWSNMLLEYPSSGYSQPEATAAATLMYDCSVMLQADFCPVGGYGTGAYINNIPSHLITYMGYDKNIRIIVRDNYNTSEWKTLMHGELDNNRPVFYAGFGSSSMGHAFILDGYTDQEYYHVNWGWGGNCNGYFLLTALAPERQGAGGSEDNYSEVQLAVIGIQKNTGAKGFEELRFLEYSQPKQGFSVNGTIVSGTPFTLYMGGLLNTGTITFNGDIMVAVADKQGKIVEELYKSEVKNLRPFDNTYEAIINDTTINNITIHSPILPGYRIRGYYRSANTPEWTIIRGGEENGYWDMLIADEYSIEETTQLTYNKKSHLLRMLVKDGISVSLRSSDNNDCSDKCQIRGNEITVDTSLLQDGTYFLILQKGDDSKTMKFSIANATDE